MQKIFGLLLAFSVQCIFAQNVRNVGDFTALKVYDKINVELISSEATRVETESAEVETINKNGELKIRMMPAKILQGGNVIVKVYYQTLNEVQASQGATVFSRETLQASRLTLVSNEGSKVNLTVEADRLSGKTNSGGELRLNGSATHLDGIANSGGMLLLAELEADTATVAANAGGFAEVAVSQSVSATARGGGIIDVYGDPSDRTTKYFLGGTINFK